MTQICQDLHIQKITSITHDIKLLTISSPAIAAQAYPGQFLMVRPLQFSDPLLPRPFSIHRVRGNSVDILFRVVGEGTKRLSHLNTGELLEVRGPLGRGFRFDQEQDLVLVAGGMGVAPLLFVAETWKARGRRRGQGSLKVFLGARNRSDLLCLKEFERAGAEIFPATEDGSWGEKGLVTDLLRKKISRSSPGRILLACGPEPMLKVVRNWAVARGIPCQVSLETRMACGLGVCLGCVTSRKQGDQFFFVNVCQEGPVFEAAEVLGDE
ncbi:MAG: dihydroorotate dehydrogenase electron transfer subunit [Thermodesulfobacteriota bacterium]